MKKHRLIVCFLTWKLGILTRHVQLGQIPCLEILIKMNSGHIITLYRLTVSSHWTDFLIAFIFSHVDCNVNIEALLYILILLIGRRKLLGY